MSKNIALIGFMGTGKTSVGKILAKRLNRPVVDVDLHIEANERKALPPRMDQAVAEEDGEETRSSVSQRNQPTTLIDAPITPEIESRRQMLRAQAQLLAANQEVAS